MNSEVEDKNLAFLFLRVLVSEDYGAINKNQKKMAFMAKSISNILELNLDIYEGLEDIFRNKIFDSRSLSKREKYKSLKNYLKKYLTIPNALEILFNCQQIIGPLTNEALEENGKEVKIMQNIAMDDAKTDLKINGDNALSNLISNWSKYSYEASQVIKDSLGHELVKKMELSLKESKYPLNEELQKQCINSSLVLFHGRCTNGGKKSAGDGLELSVQCILEHIGKKLEDVPPHITGILEADHVIKKGGKFGNMLLISCKTTARERYKQAMVENRETLLKLKISRVVWFFRDCDLSFEQCRQLGLRGHIIYLPDHDVKYREFLDDHSTKKYVRPISTIRDSIEELFDPSFDY